MEWHSGPGIRVANTPLDKLPYHVFTMCARLLLNLHNRSAIALHEHDDYRSLGSISFNSNTTEYKCHKIIKQYIDSMRITYTWAYHIHYSFETLGSFVMSYIVVCEVRHNCNIEMLPMYCWLVCKHPWETITILLHALMAFYTMISATCVIAVNNYDPGS